ncbi:DUF4123 domain-containing protein [Robbsia andropogonis]|nr:DUF4123 domain-containing protein [Robbsia andropogonis]
MIENRSHSSEAAVVETTVLALRDYFTRHRAMHCLVLVDPQPRALPQPAKGKPSLAALPRATIAIKHEAFPADHQPYLLSLDPTKPHFGWLLGESVRVALADRRPDAVSRGPGQRIGGWLATASSADEIAVHLSQHALQTDDRGKTCVLRFQDSRAFALLWPCLTLMQRETLLGPVKTWHALDAGARLTAYTGLYDAMVKDLMLKPEQWAAIRRHGIVNRAIALHMNATDRQPTPEEIGVAVAAAGRAHLYGLDRADALFFIDQALTWHPHFDSHPRILKALGEVSRDYFYAAAAGELSQQEIDEIKSGAWYVNNNIGTFTA